MIKTIFVDYDDTLHDSQYIFEIKLDGFLKMPGRRLWEIYLKEIHRGIIHRKYPERHDDGIFHCKLLFEYINTPFRIDLAKKFLKAYHEARMETWTHPRFFSDTELFLQSVKNMNLKLCLTTGDYADKKTYCMRRTFKKDFFDYIFDENKVNFRKLDPKYYLEALTESGSSSNETICIGDTLEMDIGSSKTAGIKTIWLNRHAEEPGEVQPDYIAKDLREVLDYLAKH